MKHGLPLSLAALALTALTACGTETPAGQAITHHRTDLPTSSAAAPAGRTATSGATTSVTAPTETGTNATGAAPQDAPASVTGSAPAAGPDASTGAPAPQAATRDDGSRRLTVPVLGIAAPVTHCATADDNTVTPPSDIDEVCRWTGSQPYDATSGTTIIVGHSTRSEKSVGALEYVRELKVGDTATVAGQTWRVVEVLPGVDKHSLPEWIVDHSGPRQLGLVTCETSSHTRNDIARLVPVG